MTPNSKQHITSFPRFFIILTVPLLLFSTLLAAYLKFVDLKVEFHTIIILAFILIIFVTFIKHNAWYSYAKYINSLEGTILEVEEYINQNELEIGNKRKAYGTIEPFFDLQFKKIRNDNFASVAASTFPTLGILGTFIAIAISMPDFSVESQAALDKEITILLNGVGTAFYASIYGIFLSLWWVFFEKRGLSKIQKSINETKNFYKNRVWNKEEIDVLSLVQNKEQNERIIKTLESITSPKFIQSLDEIAQSKIDLINKLNNEHVDFETNLNIRYQKNNESFDISAQKQEKLLENYEKLNELILNMNSSTSNSLIEHNKYSKALKAEIYTVLSSFELISSDLKSLGQDLIKQNLEENLNHEQR